MARKQVTVLVFEDDRGRFKELMKRIRGNTADPDLVIWWCKAGKSILDEDGKVIRELEDADLTEGRVDLIVVDLMMPPPSDEFGPFGGIVILQRIYSVASPCRSVVAVSNHIKRLEKHPAGRNAVERFDSERGLIVIDRDAPGATEYSLFRQIVASRRGRRILDPRTERQILFVGRTDDPVLILGEAGSGKEGIARGIHNAWCAHKHAGEARPFVALNSGGLRYDLMQSELFGHEKGAFTGADRGKIGEVFRACGLRDWAELVRVAGDEHELPDDRKFYGTLFFDEIGNLDLECQGLLLRLLEKPYAAAPVSCPEISNVRPRIIAATNSEEWIRVAESGIANPEKVRGDLFERVARHIMVVPSLKGEHVRGVIRAVADDDVDWDEEAIRYTAELVEGRQIRGNMRGLINFMRRTELLVKVGGDLGWNFPRVTRDVLDLSLSQRRVGIGGPVGASGEGAPQQFRTPGGNSVGKETVIWAMEYAAARERGVAASEKESPGKLVGNHGQAKAELIFLTWLALYGKKRGPKRQKVEKFRATGARKWFRSESKTDPHRTVQEAAKGVLKAGTLNDLIAKAEEFRAWCIDKRLWVDQL